MKGTETLTAPAIEAVGVSKRLGGRLVVSGVDLRVPRGSVFGLVGANGAGKTTLLRLFMGWYRPDAGHLKVAGQSMIGDVADIRQQMVYVGEDGNAFSRFTVAEMFAYASRLYERWDKERCRRLAHALELPTNQRLARLSPGMRMQVKLAVALSARPSILLLDEPTNGLDPVLHRQFLQLLAQEAADGATLVMATHNLVDVERMVDHIAFMFQGRIVYAGGLEDLRQRVRQVRAVLSAPLPASLPPDLAACVWDVEQSGRWCTLTVEGPAEPVTDYLRQQGAEALEVVRLDLDELFQLVMQREGYARDGLVLAQGTHL
ncbi:ABC transporter ATP-binding protein [Alicyclobacillus kakegawensis]|uniref:ABC transporter ATP-binding protein n=1 Tax=Alicyclobacillus kakegawensis TaxID=392012 RepID=UPI00082D708A|nr:ABC transporter ATP-binding protein [Alicyclobacillus kakegawensis]